jgi:hypothetical protein
VALAAPDPNSDAATAAVTVTVDEIIEWAAANFATIAIPNITAHGDTPDANQSLVLYTNCALNITADHSTAARLTKTTDTLVTEYKLEYDGDGDPDTGGATVDWAEYDTFIPVGSLVTHYPLDGAVNVTLSARASNAAGTLADAGNYTATQTLTATF